MNTFCHTPNALAQLAATLHQGSVLVVGDIMLDAYLKGSTDRISPEAPVPVVHIAEEQHLLGGAGNVAKNITALQGNVCLVGVKGQDQAGQTLAENLAQHGIKATLHTLKGRPTTVKTRVIAQQQQMLRFDKEVAAPHKEAESQVILQSIAEYLPEAQAVVLSDYGKGLVTPYFMQGLHALLAEHPRSLPVLVDPKPVNTNLYHRMTLLTPNAKEAAELSHMPVQSPEEIKAAGLHLMRTLELKYLTTTLGPDGMAVFTGDTVWHIPTTAKRVFDVTGAGDTVIATMALGLSAGYSLVNACMLANYAAGIVVGEVGAATASLETLQNAILQLPFTAPEVW